MSLYPRVPSEDMFPTKGPVPPAQIVGRDDAVAALTSQLRSGGRTDRGDQDRSAEKIRQREGVLGESSRRARH